MASPSRRRRPQMDISSFIAALLFFFRFSVSRLSINSHAIHSCHDKRNQDCCERQKTFQSESDRMDQKFCGVKTRTNVAGRRSSFNLKAVFVQSTRLMSRFRFDCNIILTIVSSASIPLARARRSSAASGETRKQLINWSCELIVDDDDVVFSSIALWKLFSGQELFF